MPLHKSLSHNEVNKKGGRGSKKGAHKEQTQMAPENKKIAKNEKAPTTLISEKVRKKDKKKSVQKKDEKKCVAKKQEKEVEKKQVVAEKEEKPPETANLASVPYKVLLDATAGDGSNIVYVGREDLEMLQLQQSIGSEISEHWKPPRGVPRDKTCVIRMLVDWHGVVQNIIVEKTSKITMYDVCARKAVAAMKVPQAAWGKELSITFKQA